MLRTGVYIFFTFLPFIVFGQNRTDTLTIIGVGDIMLGTSYPGGYLPPDDGRYLLKPVKSILEKANITFGNHEGTLFNGTGTPKKCKDVTMCYAFKSPEHYATYLAAAGFDMMSIANNHSGDFGPVARQRTHDVLQQAGIATAGTIKKPYVVLQRDGVRYGLAAFAPNVGTPSINNLTYAKNIIRQLDSISDIVIVSFHGGAEGNSRQHVTRKKEIFVGEDRGNVYQFARAVIDAGADVVFGHGPHVTRAVDLYKDRFIIYSLGNFATYGRFNLKDAAGVAPIMKVSIDRQGRFLKGKIFAVKQEGEGGPVPDPSGDVTDRIRSLTQQDFPEAQLTIREDGIILKKDQKLRKN